MGIGDLPKLKTVIYENGSPVWTLLLFLTAALDGLTSCAECGDRRMPFAYDLMNGRSTLGDPRAGTVYKIAIQCYSCRHLGSYECSIKQTTLIFHANDNGNTNFDILEFRATGLEAS